MYAAQHSGGSSAIRGVIARSLVAAADAKVAACGMRAALYRSPLNSGAGASTFTGVMAAWRCSVRWRAHSSGCAKCMACMSRIVFDAARTRAK